jgi:hypothetical protein
MFFKFCREIRLSLVGPILLGATLVSVIAAEKHAFESKAELLGPDVALTFAQDDQGLTVTPGGEGQPLPGISNEPP